ncbi:hypothetical protein ACI8AA_21015 [Geodermatophilus sp. SYSU D01180]
MLVVLTVVVLVVLAVAAFVVVQASRYGGLRAAFSGDLKEQRQALAAGRSRVNALRKQREAELRDARRGDEQARAAYDQRVADLQQRVAVLENPGLGRKLTGLKDVKLHEHAVEVSRHVVPLFGARAHVETTPESAILYVTAADGSMAHRAFDTRLKDVGDPRVRETGDLVLVEQKRRQDFSATQIHGLATAINNAVVAEHRFVEQLPAMRTAAAADLEQAITDTGAVEAATQRLREVEAGTPTVTELAAAQEELDRLEAMWQGALSETAPRPQPATS